MIDLTSDVMILSINQELLFINSDMPSLCTEWMNENLQW